MRDWSQAESEQDMAGEADDRAPFSLPESVAVRQDLAYGADPAQRVDVYLPRAPRAAPVLFMVHGGAWMLGDKAHGGVVANKVGRWVPKGYILVSVNYRLSPPEPLQQARDVAKALAFTQREAGGWGGDANRIVVVGHSAGAHLVALLAADPQLTTAEGARPWLGTVALDSAAYDVEEIMRGRHFRFYDRVFKDDPAYWRSASPLHRLTTTPRPLLAVCSSQRRRSCPQAQAFARKVTALGGRAEVLPVAKSHKEINHELGLPGPYTDAVEAFIRSLGMP